MRALKTPISDLPCGPGWCKNYEARCSLRGQLARGRGCSSVVERHVANVNVVGSSPITRLP